MLALKNRVYMIGINDNGDELLINKMKSIISKHEVGFMFLFYGNKIIKTILK